MEVRDELKELIEKAKLAAVESGELPKGDYPPVQRLELSPKKEFGDYSSNAAMQWARVAHMAPLKIAEILVEHIDSSRGICFGKSYRTSSHRSCKRCRLRFCNG